MRLRLAAVSLLIAVPLVAQPTISTVTPSTGFTDRETYVHIHGTNFAPGPGVCRNSPCLPVVSFGGTFGTVVDATSSQIVVIAPKHAAGSVVVHVIVPSNGDVIASDAFRFLDPPPASDVVRLLVPIAIGAAGALGTNWRTDVYVNNASSQPLSLGGTTIAPSSTAAVSLSPPPGNPGAFLYVPKDVVDDVTTTLRVHETTRDADSWGTEVPVVRESDFKRRLVLIDVPTDPRDRTLLRVYGFPATAVPIEIDVRDDATGELLLEQTLLLQSGAPESDPPVAPAYGQLALDPLLIPLATTHPRVRVDVTSTSVFPPPLWGFIAVTNNTTQQVTTITPGSAQPAVPPNGITSLRAGHWGGEAVCVDIDRQMVISSSCALSTFALPAVRPNGEFATQGAYVVSLGPPPPGIPVGAPAVVTGVVHGTDMTITMKTPTLTIGPTDVHFGAPLGCPGPCP